MGDCVVLEDAHDGGNGHTVIASERRAASLYPFSVNVCLDGVGLKIVCAFFRFLGHHVHVALQGDDFTVFVARRGGFVHEDVSSFILMSLYAVF